MTDPALDPGATSFIDNSLPSLKAGNYWINVTHTLGKQVGGAIPFEAKQEFVVSAPQFVLDPAEVISRHPANASSGRFGEQLPHVVLREPSLPWERGLGEDGATPWLALLVLTEDEIIGGEGTTTRTVNTTVGAFLNPTDSSIVQPAVLREDDVDPSGPVTTVRMSVAAFTAVVPRLDELRFLGHCRQSAVTDKAAMKLRPDGLSSVVVSSRFPAAPAADQLPIKNIVHLVSLEGWERYLAPSADFGGKNTIALVSLASWSFQCLPQNDVDFRGLVNNLVASERSGASYDPGKLSLRLAATGPGDTDATAEVGKRLSDGFVPLTYHARTGEESFAWYRGPLTPVRTVRLASASSFLTADAAIAYQDSHGVFDMSYAAAFETGRTAAIADQAFGQRMLALRRRSQTVADQLLERRSQPHFTSRHATAGLAVVRTAADEFLSVLNPELIDRIGALANVKMEPSPSLRAAACEHAKDPRAAIKAFHADPGAQGEMLQLVDQDVAAVADWLGRLALLYPVPFDLLVPDARLLPPESLRFFYVDANWTRALIDGALSIGLESSRQSTLHAITREPLHTAALAASRRLRQAATGVATSGNAVESDIISGFLLRSALVSGWPNLSVQGYAAASDQETLNILRMDHLSPSVLLVLFQGTPARIKIAEPQEGFRLGVDDNGNVTLRNLVQTSMLAPGQQVGDPFRIYDPSGKDRLCVRASGSRVLDLGSSNGLLQQLQGKIVQAGASVNGPLTPAQFAVQMVRAPEAIVFSAQPD
jgi:hypothetical protein